MRNDDGMHIGLGLDQGSTRVLVCTDIIPRYTRYGFRLIFIRSHRVDDYCILDYYYMSRYHLSGSERARKYRITYTVNKMINGTGNCFLESAEYAERETGHGFLRIF